VRERCARDAQKKVQRVRVKVLVDNKGRSSMLIKLKFPDRAHAQDFVTLAELDKKRADVDDFDSCVVVADFNLLRVAQHYGGILI